MSSSEEKMFILKMLEEGKINSEEASRLIEALDGGTKQNTNETASKSYKQPNFHDEIFNTKERLHQWKKEFQNNYNQKDFDNMVDEFSLKAEKLGKNVASTTIGIVDKVIDFVGSFVDTNAFNIFGSYTAEDRCFEAPADEGMELEIEGLHGHIQVKKHDGNMVLIKSRVRSPQDIADKILVFEQTEDKVRVKLNKSSNASVSHEISIPVIRFKSIKLETVNGRINVEDSLSESFVGITRNSSIDLMGVKSDRISVTTKNARIQLGYVVGKEIDINTNNSVIDIKNVKAESLKAVTMNGRIAVENVQNYDKCSEMKIVLKTSNGGIKVNMNDLDNKGYKVKAQTTNGGVNLLIPDITYRNIEKHSIGGSFVEAESKGYDEILEKVSIEAETVNGFIEIVK
jgi:DUF4097 and DUF4098 domain-containing protein YvlB